MLISEGFGEQQLDYLRSINPHMVVLYSGLGTYDPDTGPLGSQWLNAPPTSPEFECFYRGTKNQVLKVDFWDHGMFNMGNDWCLDAIVDHLESGFQPQNYDGVFFDRVTQVITPWVLDGIDLDHDGRVDDWDIVNAAHWRGTERLLDLVHQRLGDDQFIVANDAPLLYTTRLNGREYETMIRSVLDSNLDWTWFRYNYEQWMLASREPRLTMVMANPPLWMEHKYGHQPYVDMKPALVQEAASYYKRMRFGLTTALMEGGLYSYEFGPTWHGNAWWYDEYDAAGLGKGYLGSPLGEARYALGPLVAPNVVQNPDFEELGFAPWVFAASGAQATLVADPVAAPFTTAVSARVDITSVSQSATVRLQQEISLTEGQQYTLSFWSKATTQLWEVKTSAHALGEPDVLYGLKQPLEVGTAWQQFWVPFTATASTSATLSFAVDHGPGSIWIDRVRLQEGALPTVLRRDFEGGIALCNATTDRHTVPLGKTYRRIGGRQAPLVRIIVDDADSAAGSFARIGGWAEHDAGYDDWGSTYYHALTTTDPGGFLSRAIWRPSIPHAARYTIYVWAAPHPEQNGLVQYVIDHAEGTASVEVNLAVSEPNWVNLGSYPLNGGTDNALTLTNYSGSQWVIADAAKFESVARYNDGAEVTSVTLEGMEGVVLLNELPRKTYLPEVGRP
jgi:hypothetical protein